MHTPPQRSRGTLRAPLMITVVVAVTVLVPNARAATSGTRLWVGRYSRGDHDTAYAVATSPDGSTVFVTGEQERNGHANYATVAYSVATGAKLWARRYDGPINGTDVGIALTVSPDGSSVFVTGSSEGAVDVNDYGTVAYAAADGATEWRARYRGPTGSTGSDPVAIGTGGDGSEVFVTGTTTRSGGTTDYATVAYDTSNGSLVWARRYNDPTNENDDAAALVVSPEGSGVFVTGTSMRGSATDRATIAYEAATGAVRWLQNAHPSARRYEEGTALGVSPDGTAVFVTGRSGITTETIAYSSSTGATVWASRFRGTGPRPTALGVTQDGTQLFIAGSEHPKRTKSCSGSSEGPCLDYFTAAYDALTGDRQWVRRFSDDRSDNGASLAIAPDGSKVFVSGTSYPTDYATVAYSASTGARSWVAYYPAEASSFTIEHAISASPDGSAVFVTGESDVSTSHGYATVAYAP